VQYGSTLDQLANAVAVDATGDVFVTGQYSGTIDFGNGPLATASSAQKRIFVAKLTNTGVGQASRSISTSGQQRSVAIATDPAGNVVIGGSMVGTVDFGVGAPLVSAGAQDAFAAKISADLKTTLWAERFGDSTSQNTLGLAVDGAGNVIVSGLFQGSIDAGTAGALTSAGGFDAFVLKLDGATGTAKCARSAGDASDQSASGVAVNATSGDEYVLGTFLSSIDWGGGAIAGDHVSSETFLVKLH
jgi:hypothetical protein